MDVVTMPQLGETVTEGTITRWAVAVGDRVAPDDALFEVSTEKVDTEVPSAVGGYVRELLVDEGETVPVGAPVAVITETADEPLGDVPVGEAPDAPPGRSARAADAVDPPGSAGGDAGPDSTGDGGGERAETRVQAVASVPAGSGSAPAAVLSPVVRRLLDERGLEPDRVAGSGRDGRITRADVLAAAALRDRIVGDGHTDRGSGAATANGHGRTPPPGDSRDGVAVAPGPAPGGTGAGNAAPSATVDVGPEDRVVEFSKARLATAHHMRHARDTAAHALVSVSVDWSAVDAVRRAAGLTYLPFVARAVVDALDAFPELNAVVDGERLVVRRSVHLGVAVDLDGEALVVPVLRDAERLRLRALAAGIDDLADRARRRRLPADAFAGGSFTLTNVGSYGTAFAAPIVNTPQVAILSIDGVAMTPVAVRVDGDPSAPFEQRQWGVAVHPVGNLSLSFDHRAIDGAYAAAFLARVRDALQEQRWDEEVGP